MNYMRANTDKVVWRVVDGEAVLVHGDTSAYYGLNATGTYIWESLLTASLTPEDIASRVSARYGVGHDAFRGDIEAFLASLNEESLLLKIREPVSPAAGEPAGDGGRPDARYEPPTLTRFGELEQLVLSGE